MKTTTLCCGQCTSLNPWNHSAMLLKWRDVGGRLDQIWSIGIDGCNQKRTSLCCTTVLLRPWWYVRLRLHRYFWAYTASFAEHAARTTIEPIGLDVWSYLVQALGLKAEGEASRRPHQTSVSLVLWEKTNFQPKSECVRCTWKVSFLHMWNLTWVDKHRNHLHLESLPSCTSGPRMHTNPAALETTPPPLGLHEPHPAPPSYKQIQPPKQPLNIHHPPWNHQHHGQTRSESDPAVTGSGRKKNRARAVQSPRCSALGFWLTAGFLWTFAVVRTSMSHQLGENLELHANIIKTKMVLWTNIHHLNWKNLQCLVIQPAPPILDHHSIV